MQDDIRQDKARDMMDSSSLWLVEVDDDGWDVDSEFNNWEDAVHHANELYNEGFDVRIKNSATSEVHLEKSH